MKLVHPYLDIPLEWTDAECLTLVMENANAYRGFLEQLIAQTNGASGDCVLSEDMTLLPLSKAVHVIVDPFSLDFNAKRLQTKMYALLHEATHDQVFFLRTQTLQAAALEYVYDVLATLDLPIECNAGWDIDALFKAVGVKICDVYDQFDQQLEIYIDVLSRLLPLRLFVLVNLKCFLPSEMQEAFLTMLSYKKIPVLLLEHTATSTPLTIEKQHIIDEDMCQIC